MFRPTLSRNIHRIIALTLTYPHKKFFEFMALGVKLT